MKKIFLILIILIQVNLCVAQFLETTFPNIPKLTNSKCVCGDINADGYQDIVLMGEQPDKYVTSAYINNSDHFSQLIIPGLMPLSNGSLSLIDFNNDNYLDLFCTGSDKDGNKHTLLFKNINGTSFSKVVTSFTNVNLSNHAWLDFNNDGFLDLVLSGLDDKNQIITQTYLNNKNEDFSLQELNLINTYSGKMSSVDYNKDGWTDILITGKSEGANKVCYLYKNEKGKRFNKVIELDGLTEGDSEWGDINNDGYPDLVIGGYDGETYQLKIFTNNNGTFQFSQDLSIPLGSCDLEWLDYDGDEDLDLLCIGGVNNTTPTTVLYTNNNAIFSNSNTTLLNLFSGCIGVADFNNDSKADIYISGTQVPEGPKSLFYMNNHSFEPESPTAPTMLNSVTNYSSVTLNWNEGSDNTTSPQGLQYRLKLGSTEENSDFYPFYSNLTSNKNLRISRSEINNNNIEIDNLPEGKYYWAVQSIDIAGNTSPLSNSQSFYINAPINLGEDLDVCVNEQIQLKVPVGNYTTNWYTESDGEIAKSTNNISLSITKDETVWVELNKDYGGVVYDTIKIFSHKAPELHFSKKIFSCPNEDISITPITDGTFWMWKNFNGEILSTKSTYNFINTKKDSLILEVKSDYLCESKDTCFIYLHELPEININKEYYTCKNQQITIKTDEYYKINWLDQDKESLTEKTSRFTYNVDKKHTFYLRVENKEGCSNQQEFSLTPYPSPTAYAGKDTLVCEGIEIKIGPEIMATEGAAPYDYVWTSSNTSTQSNDEHPVFEALQTTEFTLNVTDSNGCKDQDTVRYTINPKSIINAGTDKSICAGESLNLGGDPTAQNSVREYKYKWTPAIGLNDAYIANPIATPTTTTEYKLTVSTHNCTELTDSINVIVNFQPEITIKSDTVVGSNQEFALWAKGAYKYEWTPEYLLNDPMIATPTARITENTNFSVIGYSKSGCKSNEKNIYIQVDNDVFIPTLFTPNNDSKNDNFLIYGTGILNLKIRIYNSWGKVVFRSNNANEIQKKGWNGTCSGRDAPEGSYIWELEGTYSDGRYWKKTGTIYLMR